MSIGNLILGVNSVAGSYLVRFDSLLQNVTDIITKCDRRLLQNTSGFLLQNMTCFIPKCDSYYKLREFYYKVRC